jgi:hypothetical protein
MNVCCGNYSESSMVMFLRLHLRVLGKYIVGLGYNLFSIVRNVVISPENLLSGAEVSQNC